MKTIEHNVDLCVVGGGIAGLCTAVSAARHGISVVLMQDRPVLGGNASSEIRMWICGAEGTDVRETGIVEELMLENYYRNQSLSYSIWDSVLYEKARFEPNITLLCNCSCHKAETEGSHINSVTGWQTTTETFHVVHAKYFADCSGDSILAPLTGAEYMQGREARDRFGESIAPALADKKTMGMSCLFQIRETDRPQTYIPPAWAYEYPDDDALPYREHGFDLTNNFWWIELGGMADSIHDTEDLKDELLKIAFGVWDHVKNKGDHGFTNWALDWVGFLPGKRESRRYVGPHIITQNDVEAEGRFPDVVAYGGWTMDDHFPEGFYYQHGCSTIWHPAPSPWGIPWRSLYSVNIDNLCFAGRNISTTHVALSSSRVMATCGVVGQALGTGVAQAVKTGAALAEIDIPTLQQTLMYDDCYLPFMTRVPSPLTQKARVNTELIRNGRERGDENCYTGDTVTFTFDQPETIREIRLVFDSNLNRRYDNMPCNYPLNQPDYQLPGTLVKAYRIYADGELIAEESNNYQRLRRHSVSVCAKEITVRFSETRGCDEYRVFAVDLL
ncbi:MAG: FAD-dependent oxidoreductase [Clostridia bacterium]